MLNKVALYSLLVSLQAAPGLGHTLIYSIKIGGKEYPGWSDSAGVSPPGAALDAARIAECIQRPVAGDGWLTYNDPNVATAETESSASQTAPAKGGDEITVTFSKWWPVLGLAEGNPHDDHHGPIEVYMAKCKSDCNGEKGADMDWFKTHEWGYDASAKQFASQKLGSSNPSGPKMPDGAYPFVHHSWELPTGLPGGNYLVRDNIIALQSKPTQYYPRAFQISLEGPDGAIDFTTGKFPAIYTETTPRNKDVSNFDTWNSPCKNEAGTLLSPNAAYQIPGLEVIPGGVSVDSNNVAICPASEGGVKPGVAGGPQDSAPNSAATSDNPAAAATTGSDGPSAQISSSSVQGAETANAAPTGPASGPDAATSGPPASDRPAAPPTGTDPSGVPSATIDLKNKAVTTDTIVAPAATDSAASTATDAATTDSASSDIAPTAAAPTVPAQGAPNGSADSTAAPPPVEEGYDPIAWTECGKVWSDCVGKVPGGQSIEACEAARLTCTAATLKTHRRRKVRRDYSF